MFADNEQWVLVRARKCVRQRDWRRVAYVGSTKTVLARVAREKEASITHPAQAVMDEWPEKFIDWRDQEDRRAA